MPKNAQYRKYRVLVLKSIFSKTEYVYFHTKFQISSIILRRFRRGNFTTPLPSQNEPLKGPP